MDNNNNNKNSARDNGRNSYDPFNIDPASKAHSSRKASEEIAQDYTVNTDKSKNQKDKKNKDNS